MIAALVQFETNGNLSMDEATERFKITAPNYHGLAGLHSKAYIYETDGSTLGGFYIWESREAAEAMYTDAWKAKATEIYGVPPVIRYFDVAIHIENAVPATGS
jgi:hypothetical protein